jgi:ATP-dependent Lhr-like helicase
MNTLVVLLTSQGVSVGKDGVVLTCKDTSERAILDAFGRLVASPPPDTSALARYVPNKATEKHDVYLGDALLSEAYAARNLDVPGAWEAMKTMLGSVEHDFDRQ